MTWLSLRTLGPFQATLRDEPLTDFRTRKVQALLVYLATERESHERDWLLNLLWPGLPERSARSNLRQILYYLRQAIPQPTVDTEAYEPLLIATRRQIGLNPEAEIGVDTHQFEALLAASQTHDHLDLYLCHQCQRDLEMAVSLYRGDFLTDFYLDDSNEFEEWANARREYFRRRALDALGVLTTIAVRQQNYTSAQQHAERQLEIDNLRESGYRQLMQVLALSGRREQAATVYDACRRVLAEELGMAPSERTTELYKKIVAGDMRFDTYAAQGVRGYELKEQISEGAHGTVHRAIQPVIGREVAVKVIHRRLANDASFIRRFEAEAQTIARLEHPYIVPLYDYWRDPSGAYLVMRYMRHGSLLSGLATGPWPPERASSLLTQVASALAVAHRHGVVHRDVKPGNILLDEVGNAYLSDFGIARDLTREELTGDGAVLGTLDYISPEQILNEAVSPQSDIYSLGAVLYEILTGEKPFGAVSIATLLHHQLHEPLPLVSASRPEISPEIDTVLRKATAKKPAERYGDVLELAKAFSNAVRGMQPQVAGGTLPVPEEVYNPYKGLRAFEETDADDFFGREEMVQQLLERMAAPGAGRESRFLAVVGPSGSGKSSVVKAGLIPALRAGALPGSDKWFIAQMVPGTHPLEELELALWPVAVDPPPSLVEPMERDTRGLLRTIRRILPDVADAQLLLVIDQFEELFTLVEDGERRDFFLDSLLAAIHAPRSPLRVVVTLRADFYDRPLQLAEWGQLLKDNSEVILPLNHTELTWAIREPARRMGVVLEEGLTAAIVSDVAEQPGALPLLQFAMTELFEQRENRRISHQDYERIGGVRGALGRRAEALYAELDEGGKAAAGQLFLRLVTLGEGLEDTRRRVLATELEALAGVDAVATVLDRFGEARLLTFDRDPLTRVRTVEVAHEALLREWPRLRTWLDESRADVRLQRLLASAGAEWYAAHEAPGFLLRGSRLDQFDGWAEQAAVSLTAGEQRFLDASLKARQQRRDEEEARRQRELETAQQLAETERRRAEEQSRSASRLRRRAVFLAGALGVAALLAVAAVFFARESSLNAESAQSSAFLAATREMEALANAELAATREVEALANAELAQTREADAEAQRLLAEQEAEQRAIAQGEAEQAADLAFSRELAAAALDSLDEDPERSILLAMHALSVTYTTQAEEALHAAIQSSRVRNTLTPNASPGYLSYHAEKNLLFTGGGEGTMWDLTTGTVVFTRSRFVYPELAGDSCCIGGAAFSLDGSLLLVPHEEWTPDVEPITGTLAILDADTGREILSFAAHDVGMQEVVLNEQGTHFATTGGLRELKVWDLAATLAAGTGQETATLCCHSDWIWSAAFSPDGSRLASTSQDATVKVWEIGTERELFSLNISAVEAVFSPDGEYLLVGETNGNISVLDADTGELHSIAQHLHSDWVWGMGFSPDGKRLVTGSGSGHVAVWDYENGELAFNPIVLAGQDRASGAVFTSDGRYVIVSDWGTSATVRVWDVSPAGASEFGAFAHEGRAQEVVFSPDGSWLASVGHDGTAKVWEVVAGEERSTAIGHDGWAVGVAIHPEGSSLATTGDDGTVRIWDPKTGEELLVIEAHEHITGNLYFQGTTSVSYSPDGQHLATGGVDDIAKIWDLGTGEQTYTLTGHTGDIMAIAYSPDGHWLMTGSYDGQAKIWDPTTGQEQWNLDTSSSLITTAAFSVDSSRLAAGISGGDVYVWQLPVTEADAEMEPELVSHFTAPGELEHVAFSPNGNVLAVTGLRESALYDAQTGERIMNLVYPSAGADFSPDGRMLALAGADGVVRILATDLDTLLALARTRVTRTWREVECQQYLHMETCPPPP